MSRHKIIPVLLVLAFSPAMAVDTLQVSTPDPILEDWRWTEFDRSSGLAGNVQDIFEDRDGNIWFATGMGAQRYDGLHWTTYTVEDGLAHNHVSTVTQTRDGAMWFGTHGGGISRFDGKTWTTYTSEDGLASNWMWWRGLRQAPDGTLWAGFMNPMDTSSAQNGISRFDGKIWTTLDMPVGNPRPKIMDIHTAADGSVWFGCSSGGGVLRFDGADWTRYTPAEGLAGKDGIDIFESRDGSIWVTHFASGNGISRFDGKRWQTYTSRDGLPENVNWLTVWQTEDGTIWASGGKTLCRFNGERWKAYTDQETSRFPGGLCARTGSDGVVWFWGVTRDRAFRFNPESPWTVYTHPDGLTGGLETGDGSVWFRTTRSAVRFKDGLWMAYTPEDGFLDGGVTGIQQTKKGSIWFTGKHRGDRAVARYGPGRWQIHTSEEVSISPVYQRTQYTPASWPLLETRDGSLWLTGQHNGKAAFSRFDGQAWRRYTEADGVVGEIYYRSYEATDGTLWFGSWHPHATTGDGLLRFDGQTWTHYTEADGLSSNHIIAFGEWPAGTLWVGTIAGVSRLDLTAPAENPTWVNKTDFQVVGPKPGSFVAAQDALWFRIHPNRGKGVVRYDGKTWRTYTQADGMAGNSVRRIIRVSDGAVWFAGQDGLSRFDGDHWSRFTAANSPPSLVGKEATMREMRDGSFWLGNLGNTVIRFRYRETQGAPETVLEPAADQVSSAGNILLRWSGHDRWNHTLPGDLRYQWQMDGGGWSNWSGRTDFTFTELGSGGHRFEIRAIDREGNVDLTAAAHAFVVEFPWWKNPWVLGIAAAMLGLVGVQTGRVVRRDRRLQQTNTALSDANKKLFGLNEDLQKKTDDLTLEAALERVRAKALGMGKSEDISGVVVAMLQEFESLGLPVNRTAINIQDMETDTGEVWSATLAGGLSPSQKFTLSEARKIPEVEEVYDARRQGAPHYVYRLEGEDKERYFRRVGKVFKYSPEKTEEIIRDTPDPCTWNQIFFLHGHLSIGTQEPLPEADLAVAKRFADVFDFAYTRYLELQEKEARNRELEDANRAMSEANKELFQANQALQRDSAVERIRGEVQAMEQASDFERVLSLLSEDLKAVGLSFDTCGIDVLDEPVDEPTMAYFEEHGFQYTAYAIDPDGAVTRKSFNLSVPLPDFMQETIERFIAGEPWKALIGGTNAILEVPASNYGRLRITSSERTDFTEEDIESLQDFASAIALGYARYLDIREIQEQTERKSRFLADMSHELRTPMNAIIGFTRMVIRRSGDALPERQRENLEKVTVSADHLLSLINGILDISKIESGRTEVEVEHFDVKELIAACCATVDVDSLVKPGVALKVDVPDTIGEAHTDGGRLRQIVINLLSNALKFTEKGEVSVHTAKENGTLVIAVSDTGTGIPADALDRIFEEFRQVEGSDPEHKGTGLGLPITKGYAELLGGSIRVESEVGKGSTFTVRVPVVYSQ